MKVSSRKSVGRRDKAGGANSPKSPSQGAGASGATGAFRVNAGVTGDIVGDGGGLHPGVADEAATTSSMAPTATLGALIALQSGLGGNGSQKGRAARLAAARRILDLLENVRDGLLSGRVRIADLEALSDAASAKPNDRLAIAQEGYSDGASHNDAAITALMDDISLRARVELAKLGR